MSNISGEQGWNKTGDEELVALCQKGKTEAFGFLVERHQKRVFNMAYRMMGDYEEASEVTQDVFLSAFRSIKTFRREARFSTWLHTITVNIARNHMKQLRSRMYDQRGADTMASVDDPTPLVEKIAAPGPSVSEKAEAREIQQKVQDCINELDPEQREVIILRDMEGFSYDEIHDILKVPEGTVKSRLFRARDALKDKLKMVLGEL